jgi:hypothetical protein
METAVSGSNSGPQFLGLLRSFSLACASTWYLTSLPHIPSGDYNTIQFITPGGLF